MDPRTVELLRALQGQEQDAAAFERISTLFGQERVALREVDDLGMLSHLGELLEGWAEGAAPELSGKALTLAARSAEDDLEQPERAIKLLERVLDIEPTAEALEQLADLYMKRGGTNDAQQAADLYAALGDTLGGEEGMPYLKRAIALVPAHEASIELSRIYAAQGKYRDALVCISPLAERGNADAMRMHEAYLVNLEGAVPAKKSRRGESLPPPQVQRPARSGGTMVGFRLDEYHEALRKERAERGEDERAPGADPSENGSDPSEDSVVRALPPKPEGEPSEPAMKKLDPLQASAPVATPPGSEPMKTKLGMTAPLSAAMPAASKPAASKPAASKPAASKPAARTADAPSTKLGLGTSATKSDAGKTMMGMGIPASLAQSVARAAAPFSAPAPAEGAPTPAPAATPEPARPSPQAVSAPLPNKPEPIKTVLGLGVPAGFVPGAVAPVAGSEPTALSAAERPAAAVPPLDEAAGPPVRKSLPPPNPAVVRASSRPAPRSTRGSVRTSAAPALSGAAPGLTATAPAAAVAQPSVQAPVPALPSPAEVGATLPAMTPPVAEPVAPAQPEVFSPSTAPVLEPFTVSATPRDESILASSFAPPKPSGLPIKWIAAAVGLLVIGGGAFALMGGDDKPAADTSSDAARVESQPATGTSTSTAAAPAAAAPPAAVQPAAAPTEAAPTTALPPTAAAAATPEAAGAGTQAAAAAPEPSEPAATPAPSKPARSKHKGKMKLTARDIRVRGGRISGTQIMVALEDALPKIESCYADALDKKPRLSGKLTLGFSIQKNGKLAGARVAKSTLKNKPLESCAVDALSGQRFPKIKKAATVTLPIGLTP